MKVSLIGIGCGTEAGMTLEARSALQEAQLLIGAKRMLSSLPKLSAKVESLYKPEEILACIQASEAENICILYSGDCGIFSGAKKMLSLLQDAGIPFTLYPGISSLQLLASRTGLPWQDWNICSAHGVSVDPLKEVMNGKPTFFLTSGSNGPAELCQVFVEAGLSDLKVTVGEDLGYPEEQLFSATAQEVAKKSFAPLNVMLVSPAPTYPVRTPGIPDEEFIRDKVPMTKQEVRAAILSKLAITPEDLCWDVGSGTGSVSVELALHGKACYGVEVDETAYALSLQNREKFCAWNLHLSLGSAPEALEALPAPDAVFVGGSKGNLPDILKLVQEKNEQARICVSAIALETLQQGSDTLAELGYEVTITQIAVSRTKEAGSLHLLMAQNPIFLITGTPKGVSA